MDFHFRIEFMLQHVSDPECRQYAQKNSTEYWQFGNAQRIWSCGGPHLAIAMIPSLCEKHLQTVLTAYNGCKNMQKIAKATFKTNRLPQNSRGSLLAPTYSSTQNVAMPRPGTLNIE